jgi:CRISPR-associated endonuclease/helicase Cas3
MADAQPIYAHTLPLQPQQDWETLEVHAASVARLAESFAADFGAADWGHLLGRWHDLGKRSAEFQNYLKKSADPDAAEDDQSAGRVDHSTFGAQHAAQTLGGHFGQLLAFCIAGHLSREYFLLSNESGFS